MAKTAARGPSALSRHQATNAAIDPENVATTEKRPSCPRNGFTTAFLDPGCIYALFNAS
jgi:hypothetical protein